MDALSAFNGENMTGTWTLTVLDSYTAGDDGSIDAWSLEICTAPITTGINSSVIENNLALYPNPTSNILNVSFGNIQFVEQITLTDLQGKIIVQKKNITSNNLQLDLSNYNNGLYLLQVQSKEDTKVFKVTKQ